MGYWNEVQLYGGRRYVKPTPRPPIPPHLIRKLGYVPVDNISPEWVAYQEKLAAKAAKKQRRRARRAARRAWLAQLFGVSVSPGSGNHRRCSKSSDTTGATEAEPVSSAR